MEHCFKFLRSCFCPLPAVFQNHCPVIGGIRTVSVTLAGHSDYLKDCVIHIVFQSLVLRLVQFFRQNLYICLGIPDGLQQNHPGSTNIVRSRSVFNLTVVQNHQRLDETFNCFIPHTVEIRNRIKQCKDDLKAAKHGTVRPVFDNRDQTEGINRSCDYTGIFPDGVHHAVRVSSEGRVSFVIRHIVDCDQHFLRIVVCPDNERVPWIQCVQVIRNLLHPVLLLYHIPVTDTGNHAPLNQGLILGMLADDTHGIIQPCNAVGHIVPGNRCDILYRFTDQIPSFEGDNLICPVFNNVLCQFIPNLTGTEQ